MTKPQLTANDTSQRRAAAKRTALILAAVAVLLFVFSFIEVMRHA